MKYKIGDIVRNTGKTTFSKEYSKNKEVYYHIVNFNRIEYFIDEIDINLNPVGISTRLIYSFDKYTELCVILMRRKKLERICND